VRGVVIESTLAPGHQRAEDVRPAAARAGRQGDRGRAADRQAPGRRRRGRPPRARAPHERRAPAALRQARDAARPHLAPAAAAPGGARAAPARVRHQAGGVGQGAARPDLEADDAVATLGPRPGRRRPRTCARCWAPAARARCTRSCATSA
jgi:hypothetical protein